MPKLDPKPPWKTQRVLKKEDIPTRQEVLSTAQNIQNPKHRALYIILYLTGARISEVVRQKYLRKAHYKKKIVTDPAGNKQYKVVTNRNKTPLQESVERIEINYRGLRRNNFNWEYVKKRRILVITLPTRKNKQTKKRRLPIPQDKEKEFIELLLPYLNRLEPTEPLFNFGIAKAEQIIQKEAGMNPHFLRDIRLTHMITIYRYNAYQLTKFAGWSDSRPAERYVKLAFEDLIGGEY